MSDEQYVNISYYNMISRQPINQICVTSQKTYETQWEN